jgi:group I intron endonuclease
MINSGIYLIKNTVTNKYYIGSAINFDRRFENHINDLLGNRHRNRYLQSSYNKHGRQAFTFHILETVEDKTKLIEREQHWLNISKCYDHSVGYNLSPTAGSILGFKFSPESLIRLSNSLKGKKQSTEHIKNRFANRLPMSDEAKAKISAKTSSFQLGRRLTDNHKANIAKAMKKIDISSERRAKMVAGLRRKNAERLLTNFKS